MSDFPFTYEPFDEETNENIKRDFPTQTSGLGVIKPANGAPCVMPPEFMDLAKSIYNLEPRDNDIWVVTFPKSGTTWMQTIVGNILHPDSEASHEFDRWFFLEFHGIIPNMMEQAHEMIKKNSTPGFTPKAPMASFNDLVAAEGRRLIKSHLPLSMLPPGVLKKNKVIYVARNPQDACVSFYHHHKHMYVHDFQGDFESFFNYSIKDQVLYSHFWPHVKEAWSVRDDPNMLFMFYEDMKEDLSGSIRKLASFLNQEMTDSQVESLHQKTCFDGMKKSASTIEHEKGLQEMGLFKKEERSFIRKGIVGDWRNHFTDEMKEKMITWNQKGREGSDIVFKDELE